MPRPIARAQMRRPVETGKNAFARTARNVKQRIIESNPASFHIAIQEASRIIKTNPELSQGHELLLRLQKRFGSKLERLPQQLHTRYQNAGTFGPRTLLETIQSDSGRLNSLLKK